MLFPFNIPCQTNDLRGQLRHHWLENQVLNKVPDDVVTLRKEGWPALEKEFDLRIAQLKELAVSMVEGFSPRQLVERLVPLQQLPKDRKTALKEVLHVAYVRNTKIDDTAKHLYDEATLFEVALKEFKTLWKLREGPDADKQIRIGYEKMLEQAEKLFSIMQELPKGVALP